MIEVLAAVVPRAMVMAVEVRVGASNQTPRLEQVSVVVVGSGGVWSRDPSQSRTSLARI